MNKNEKILNWLCNGETGISSKAMAFCSLNIENNSRFGNMTPSDPADFNRCLKLVNDVHEIREDFDKIKSLSVKWEIVIENWKKIEKSFIDEVGFDWCNGKRASKTYSLMKDLGL